jgi:hypothetical protein
MPAAAGAVVSGSGLTCKGSAVITGADGKTYTISSDDTKAEIPREGSASYQGSTSPTSHDHHGSVWLEIGPGNVTVWSWSGKNDSNKPGSAGVVKLPAGLKQAPPGEYRLAGDHSAKEGSCSGHITVVIKGGLLKTTTGKVAVAGTVLSAAGMVVAGMAKAGKVAAATAGTVA